MSGTSSSPIASSIACSTRVEAHALALLSWIFVCACSSTPEPRPTPAPPIEEPAPELETEPRAPLGPVPHDGPMVPDPAFYDCGRLEMYDRCEFGVLLTNSATSPLTIEEIAQDFAVGARVGLVDDRTQLTRDLPHEMPPSERLRLLFSYRCQEPVAEQVGGSMFVAYVHDGERHRLEVPVGCH